MPTIHELAALARNRTDKQDAAHTVNGQSYLHVYERYFEPKRNMVRDVLEIGVLYGHSVRLWRDYFPNAWIYGVDIDPAAMIQNESRITTLLDDQSDPEFGEPFSDFDIVIDDGSHISFHIVKSFRKLWPKVRHGGFYCIEDTRCTYDGADGGWPGMKYNASIPATGERHLIDELLKALITDIDNLRSDVRAIHIHPMQIIFEKV